MKVGRARDARLKTVSSGEELILDDLGTEVRRFDGSEVVFIRFRWRNQHWKTKEEDKHTISRILVEHEFRTFRTTPQTQQNAVLEVLGPRWDRRATIRH